MRMKNYFQASLDVEGRLCLMVGGGAEAEEKTGRLLDAGANVTVVSPDVSPQLEGWAREGVITLIRRRFEASDLDGIHLAVNTVKSDPDLSRHIYEVCEAKRILISAYDQPEASNFVMVALVRSGRLRVAFATGATSPALASTLRAEFEQIFGDEFAQFVEYLAEQRRALEAAMPKGPERSEALRRLVRGLRVDAQVSYPPGYLAWRDGAPSPAGALDDTGHPSDALPPAGERAGSDKAAAIRG
jgi:precorrin-2 dehydrogenase/sirohydrochlorin ferrochelatase